MTDFQGIKDLIEAQGRAWEEFKRTNEARFDAIENDIARSQRPPAGGSGSAIDNAEFRNVETGAEIKAIGIEHVGRVRERLGTSDAGKGTLGDFFRAVAGLRSSPEMKASIAEGADATGGFAVPSSLFGNFIEALLPTSSVLQAGARILPLQDRAKSYRMARVGTVPSAGWRDEAGAVSESDPAFAALDLSPRSLAFFFRVSREILADSSNIDAMLRSAIAGAFAKEIDRTALRGSGTAPEPRGILNTSGVGSVTNGAAGALMSAIKWANLLDAYSEILVDDAPPPTAAIMAPRSLIGFAKLADTPGQPLQRPFLIEPMKFIASSQIPTDLVVGGSSDCSEIYVGDFRELVIGLREDVTVLRANELFAANGQVGFICHARLDIGVLHAQSFCKVTGVRGFS